MKLSSIQKADLISASNAGVDTIDAVIQRLKQECPNAFHTANTLPNRVFFHRPAEETPCSGYFVHVHRYTRIPS